MVYESPIALAQQRWLQQKSGCQTTAKTAWRASDSICQQTSLVVCSFSLSLHLWPGLIPSISNRMFLIASNKLLLTWRALEHATALNSSSGVPALTSPGAHIHGDLCGQRQGVAQVCSGPARPQGGGAAVFTLCMVSQRSCRQCKTDSSCLERM